MTRPSHRRRPRTSLPLGLVLALAATLLTPVASSASSASSAGSAVVVAANLREGAVRQSGVDLRNDADLRAFARRMLATSRGAAPDVLSFQEVRGGATSAVRALNRRLAATGRPDRYRLLTRPRFAQVRGRCGGARPARTGPFFAVRDTALLVNTRTVRRVHATGRIRTWGRWKGNDPYVGRGGHACAEHPWARLTVRRPGETARTLHVVGVHLAPHGARWKRRGTRRIVRQVAVLRDRSPSQLAVLAGDFNNVRCSAPGTTPEAPGCTPRTTHQTLESAGYVDAVHATRGRGPTPTGVMRRVDFVYVDGPVRGAWFDRCFMGFRARSPGCGKAVFRDGSVHASCQVRHERHGTPGDRCTPKAFRRYYSDHHVIQARVG